jgi:AcrR family transcriptional regulator
MEIDKRARILDAALAAFARYGWRRASMADVAQAVGVSRPALYLHFASKEALFEAVARKLAQDAMDGARAAWAQDAPFADGFAAAMLARNLPLFGLFELGPHGRELLEADEGLTAELGLQMEMAFAALVAERARTAPDVSLARCGLSAPALGRLLAAAASGVKHAAEDEGALRAGAAGLAALVRAALAVR